MSYVVVPWLGTDVARTPSAALTRQSATSGWRSP